MVEVTSATEIPGLNQAARPGKARAVTNRKFKNPGRSMSVSPQAVVPKMNKQDE
jgi:hypothetical protein